MVYTHLMEHMRMPRITYTKELLEPIVSNSKSVSDVIRHLGIVPRGGNFNTIKKKIDEFNIDHSHFIGQGWSKGLTKETSTGVAKTRASNTKHTPDTAFINNIHLPSNTIKRLFDEIGVVEKCSDCGIGNVWNLKPIRLQIDHINGDHLDNRFENLRYLCPNCHSQTLTFAGRNGTGGRTRTDTVSLPLHFECSAAAFTPHPH